MMRSLFYVFGVFLIILGTQCFFIDKFVFKFQNSEVVDKAAGTYQKIPCEFKANQNAAWCLIFVGGSLILCNLTASEKK